jgi:hypothetical protein
MRLQLLRRRHPGCDVETWARYDALFHGGPRLRRELPKLLPRHDVEPLEVYRHRLSQAHYLNHSGPIGTFFAAMLFGSAPVLRSTPEQPGEVYTALKSDCDGQGTDFEAFVAQRFIEALVKRTAYWRVELTAPPSPEAVAGMTLKDYEAAGYGRPRLVGRQAEAIPYWRCDEAGNFLWVVEHDRREELLDWTHEQVIVTETWTLWSREAATRWGIAYPKDQPPGDDTEVPQIAPPPHFGQIPLIKLELPETLWLMAFLADPALEHFRKSCGLSWSIDRSCYAMPYFFLKNPKQPPTQGAGYYGILGHEDKVEWPSPSNVPYDVVEKRLAVLKDELHRVSIQMARGVDNNAAAVGRSGESKLADAAATEVVLEAYGREVREAFQATLNLVSFALGDSVEWSVEGMDTYDVADTAAIIENALTAQPLLIPSATYQAEVKTRVALAQLRDADEEVKQKVRDEIRQNTTAEDVMAMLKPPTDDDGLRTQP